MLRSRLFHSEECRGRRVKSPVDFAIGAIRAFELFAPPPDLVDLEIHLTKMGQRLFFPPSVAGWPGGLAWLGGQELRGAGQLRGLDHRALAARRWKAISSGLARRYGLKTPENWLDALATLLLGVAAFRGRQVRFASARRERHLRITSAVAFPPRGPARLNRRMIS